jgi:hypothetical protein
MKYESVAVVESRTAPGVSFHIAKMSFGRRIELTKRIRDLAQRVEFLNAGESPLEKMDAALAAAEVDRIYVSWGLIEVEGLELNGQPATPELLATEGPEALFREALECVKRQCGLSEAERKN